MKSLMGIVRDGRKDGNDGWMIDTRMRDGDVDANGFMDGYKDRWKKGYKHEGRRCRWRRMDGWREGDGWVGRIDG